MNRDTGLSASFKNLFENSQMAAIILMDANGIILNANLGVEKSYGYKSKDLEGKHLSILFTEQDRLRNLPDIELSRVHQKHSASDQNYIVHKDGSHIWSHGETIFTKNKSGEITLVKLVYDINFQKLQEKYLIRANEELKKINQDLDSFVYSASHDLKAPINNIEALITTVEEELDDKTKKRLSEIIGMLKISIDKFKTTIADLTTAGRILANQKEEKKVYLSEVVEEIKMDLNEEIVKSQANFKEDFQRAPFVCISKKNLRSILYNLISNALKYRSPERAPQILITTKTLDKFTSIEISDNGLGIKEEDKEKIFHLYTRLHTHVEGTGVGMNLVKNIVDNVGGKIEIESEVGKGSTFKVSIPN